MRGLLRIPVVITAPATQPVTLDAVKNFARITATTDDYMLAGFIAAATEMAELYTGRALITRTLQLTLDRFPRNLAATPWWNGTVQGPVGLLQGYPDPIILPNPPLQAVTGITTFDENDADTTVDPTTYRIDTVAGRIILKAGQSWPTSLRDEDAVQIAYTAGYGDSSASVPQSICTAILMQTQIMYDSRAACGLCDGPKSLLMPYRLPKI